MKLAINQESLLDRGGNPTIREFLSKLVYNPIDGTIKLSDRRLIMQRATTRGALRDELIRLYGRDDAFIVLTRLGYLAGQEDAAFIRQAWPALDQGDAFTAGTRLHMLKGEVRVETIHNDFDFKKGRFSGEFFWNDSVEATEYLDRHEPAHEAMCWTQVGYAAGYASHFFEKLIVYKEIQCIARGDKRCRVVGRPAEAWDKDDETVRFYRRHILAEGRPSEIQPHRFRAQESSHGTDHPPRRDRDDPVTNILIEPVRRRLDQIARTSLPVLITGPCGSGKCIAARHIHDAADGSEAQFLRIHCAEISDGRLPDVLDTGTSRRRKPGRHEPLATVVLEDIETLNDAAQRRLAELLATAKSGLGEALPQRLIATSTLPLPQLAGLSNLRKNLFYGLMALPVSMPAFADRSRDIPRLAEAIARRLTAGDNPSSPNLAEDAVAWLAGLPLPGNLYELEALIRGAHLSQGNGILTAAALAAAAAEMGMKTAPSLLEDQTLAIALGELLERGDFAIDDFSQRIYQMAIRRAEGNVARAARMLGLSRAQFAYRLGQISEISAG